MPHEDLDKPEFLARIGYGGDPRLADAMLIEAGLTNARKRRISTAKFEAAETLLRARFAFVCQRGDCGATARAGIRDRAIVRASAPEFCEICSGSANRAAVDGLVGAFARAGWSRLCIVGGSPGVWEELRSLVAGRIELRLVNGTASRNSSQAADDLRWADRVVIWASTELNHRVSNLYGGAKVLVVARRGVQQLCRALLDASARPPRPPTS